VSGLFVTAGTSTVDGTSNTIYASSDNGLSIIQEKQGDEANGSVKYYTKDYITEEMVGDIRQMMPFNGSGAIANNTDISDTSVKATTMTASNANGTGMTYVRGVRGTGISFDGTDDYLTQKVYLTQAGASFGPAYDGLSLANGQAFYNASGVNLSPYKGTDGSSTPYMLVVKDSTSNVAWGYMGSQAAGETLGSELITNGSFTTDTSSWTPSVATPAISADGQSGNSVLITNTTNGYGYIVQGVSTTIGKVYKLTLYQKNGTNLGLIMIGNTSGGRDDSYISVGNASWGTQSTLYFTALGTTTYIRLGVSANGQNNTTMFDEISLKQVTTQGSELTTNGNFDSFTGTADDGASDTFDNWNNVGVNDVAGNRIEATNTLYRSGTTSVLITRTTASPVITQNVSTTAGKLYKVSYFTRGDGTHAGSYGVWINSAYAIPSTSTGYTSTSWNYGSFYFTATTTTAQIQFSTSTNNGATAGFDNVSVSEVTDPATTGVHILSTRNGSTRNWASVAGSFNYNDTSYTFQVLRGDFSDVGNSGSPFTIGIWINTASMAAIQSIMAQYNGGVQAGTYIWLYSGKPSISDGRAFTLTSNTAVNNGNWHHLVFVHQNSTSNKIYIDGSLDTSSTTSSGFIYTYNTFMIGASLSGNSPSYFFNGTIDEPFVTATALTAQQVKQMYEVGKNAILANGTNTLNGTSNNVQAVAAVPTSNSVFTQGAPAMLYAGTDTGGLSQIDTGSDTLVNYYTTSTTPAVVDNNIAAVAPINAWSFITGSNGTNQGISKMEDVSSSMLLPTNAYTNVMGMFNADSGYMRMYVNGMLAGSTDLGTSASVPTSSSPITLGSYDSASYKATFFAGKVDDFKVYNFAPNQRVVSMEASAHRMPDPMVYYKMDEGNGATLHNTNWDNAGAVGTTTNLITNPSWETGTSGWGKYGNLDTYEMVSSKTLIGNYTGHLQEANSGGSNEYIESSNITVKPNTSYTVSAYFQKNLTSGTGTGKVSIWWYASGNNVISQPGTYMATGNISTWSRYTLTATSPSNVSYAKIVIASDGISSGAAYDIWIDGAQFEENSIVTPYCDGSLTGKGTHVWNGTAHASTSTCTYGTDGAIRSATWQDNGKYGKDLSFNGTTDYANTYYKPQTGEGTMSYWVKFNAVTGNQASGTDDGSSHKMILGITGSNIYAGFGSATSSSIAHGIAAGGWHLLTMTGDGTTANLYIDGVNKGSFAYTWTGSSAQPVFIGDYNSSGSPASYYMNASIDEFKIYNYALTQAEILEDYNQTSGLKLGQNVQDITAKSQNGLVGWWKMDDNVSGDSKTLVDSSGLGNNATTHYGANTTGMDCTVAGEYSYGCSFDGVDDATSLADTTALRMQNHGFSGFAWIKDTATATFHDVIFNKGCGQATQAGYWLGVTVQGTLDLYVSDGTSYVINGVTSNKNVADNTWHLVGFTWDPSLGAKIYIDGALDKYISRNTHLSIDGTEPFNMGGFYDGTTYAGNALNGTLDDVRLYNRALSSQEVENLYNYGPAPVAWYKFDEGTGTVAKDSSTNELNGAITGGATYTPTGRFGDALNLNGTDGTVTVTTSTGRPLEMGNNSMTYEMWVYPTQSLGSYDSPFFKGGSSTSVAGYDFELGTGNWVADLSDGSNFKAIALTNETLNKWVHIAAVVDRSKPALLGYTNGIPISPTTSLTSFGSLTNASTNMVFSRSLTPFKGKIDDVRIYNYARTQKQILDDMYGDTTQPHPVASWSFDEGQGQYINDNHAAKLKINDATLQGTLGASATTTTNDPTWVTDQTQCVKGRCLSFDESSSQYVSIPQNASLTMSGPMSVSVWIKTTDTSARFVEKADNGTLYNYSLQLTSGKPYFVLYDTGGVAYIGRYYNTAINNNSWQHLVATWNGGTTASSIKIYLNGKQVDNTDYISGTFTAPRTVSGPLNIGSSASSGLTGSLDELQIFNYALLPTEVDALYNQGAANYH
jgi:hypothetical protein